MLTHKKSAGIFPPITSPAAAFTSRFTFKPSLISSVCEARTRWRGLSDDIAGREGWSGTRVVGRGRVGAGVAGSAGIRATHTEGTKHARASRQAGCMPSTQALAGARHGCTVIWLKTFLF